MSIESLVVALLLPRPRRGAIFSESERRTLAAAAEVLLAGVEFDVSLDDVTQNVERFIGRSSRATRVRVLLTLVELLPLVLGGPRFSCATPEQRIGLLRRFASGGHVFALCRRIRPLVYLGAYATENARRHVGFVEVPERARFSRPSRALRVVAS